MPFWKSKEDKPKPEEYKLELTPAGIQRVADFINKEMKDYGEICGYYDSDELNRDIEYLRGIADCQPCGNDIHRVINRVGRLADLHLALGSIIYQERK